MSLLCLRHSKCFFCCSQNLMGSDICIPNDFSDTAPICPSQSCFCSCTMPIFYHTNLTMLVLALAVPLPVTLSTLLLCMTQSFLSEFLWALPKETSMPTRANHQPVADTWSCFISYTQLSLPEYVCKCTCYLLPQLDYTLHESKVLVCSLLLPMALKQFLSLRW